MKTLSLILFLAMIMSYCARPQDKFATELQTFLQTANARYQDYSAHVDNYAYYRPLFGRDSSEIYFDTTRYYSDIIKQYLDMGILDGYETEKQYREHFSYLASLYQDRFYDTLGHIYHVEYRVYNPAINFNEDTINSYFIVIDNKVKGEMTREQLAKMEDWRKLLE